MSNWTDEKVEFLKKNWGLATARELAEQMGAGFTRNSIIGKASRLGLSAKIKTRTAASKKNFENSDQENSIKNRRGRRSKFKSLVIEKDFEPENPKQLEELTDNDCKYPIGHPDEPNFYFCGRSSLKDFSYCKLHLLYSYVQKNKKDEPIEKDEVPEFIEKKIKSA
jgi:GcrA cell cycle regulator|tara:strand:+ start:150 stop:647 length:498 start_codon:yes stop_codon:yes gene_type:complete